MTPAEYKARYLNIRITPQIPASNILSNFTTHRVSIRKYLNASDDNFSTSEKNRLVGFMRQQGYSSSDRVGVAKVFYGKGSVRQCRLAAEVIWRSGFARDGLQPYCDRHLGLDCSGFVNSYFVSQFSLTAKNISSYYRQGQSRLRVNFRDFRANDVLIWCNRRGTPNGSGRAHIAVIDRLNAQAGNELRAVVVESTGTLGLVDSIYTFIPTATEGVFRVHRPLKPATRNHVRVVPVL